MPTVGVARSPPPLLEEEAGIDDAGRGGTPGINDAAGGTASTHDLLPPLDPGFQSGMLERFVCIYKKGDDLRCGDGGLGRELGRPWHN